jgi:hypothetical protein
MTKPPPPWFDTQGPDTNTVEFKARKAALLKELPALMDRRKGGRANSFMPYLLIRSVLGDRGDRPINVPFWESPDIWTATGSPDAAPAVPSDHGSVYLFAGQPATVYAHVWNLGFAPLAGVRVEFYWFDPSLSIDGSNAHLIGMARCELAGRGMNGSHMLVKCPTAWVPTLGHKSLVVRIEGIGDPIGGNPWAPWHNRHVAQRNIDVLIMATATANLASVIAALNASRSPRTRLQLVQVGTRESELALKIAAPHLRPAAIETHVLGEIDLAGQLVPAAPEKPPPAALAPVHPLAAGGPPAPPMLLPEGKAKVIDAHRAFGNLRVPPDAASGLSNRIKAAEARTEPGGHLADLLGGVSALNPGHPTLAPPSKGEAQVLRIASYRGEQLIGGYTLVLAGPQ